MATINVSEKDFETLVGAVLDAKGAGRMTDAAALDKIARKINAALTTAKYSKINVYAVPRKPLRWSDVPSVLAP